MAVTVLQRPEGHIINTTQRGNVQIVDNGGDAQLNGSVTDFSTNDWVYVASPVEDYNGFWQVNKTGASSMKLIVPSGGFVPFIKILNSELSPPDPTTETFNFYAIDLTHGWSAVHLPITYRLSNDLYPTNGVDTTRNINSVQDANGYSALQLSGSLGSIHSFDFIKITVPNDTTLSGVYQIIEFISPTVVIINLLYDSTNNFTSATAIKYYNNYKIVVRVYAGISASHVWTAQKPYELAATLLLTPDTDNDVFFSINEILKSYIETRNNLILGTLPNNIDFWTNFYIQYAEQYDDSDGYVFGTYEGSFTSDLSTFEGTAVNAKLEFKNIQSGSMSDYLMTNNTAKFLTLFTIPVLFSCGTDTPDCYQDISFINPTDDIDLIVEQQYYSQGNAGAISNITVQDADSGVIRVTLDEADCNYDRVDITVKHDTSIPALSAFTNHEFGGIDWTTGATPSVVLNAVEFSDILITPFIAVEGVEYTFNYNITMAGGGVNQSFGIQFLDASFLTAGGSSPLQLVNGVNSGSITATGIAGVAYVGIQISNFSGTNTYTVNSLSVDDAIISETKEFKIDCGCSQYELRMTWLNNLPGFDYWAFTAKKDHLVEIKQVLETKKNILPNWPKSYGADADTQRRQTIRESNKAYTVISQYTTRDEYDAIAYIKSSVLVQIINSRTDRRTVIVDADSFPKYRDGDKVRSISFNISFTDDIPSQTV